MAFRPKVFYCSGYFPHRLRVHLQRGGTPCAYDRLLCSRLGGFAAKLAAEGRFGVTAAVCGNSITFNALTDIAGKYKFVDPKGEDVQFARSIGISFGDMA